MTLKLVVNLLFYRPIYLPGCVKFGHNKFPADTYVTPTKRVSLVDCSVCKEFLSERTSTGGDCRDGDDSSFPYLLLRRTVKTYLRLGTEK